MSKVVFAVLALVLAGTANAGWRKLTIDGSTEADFVESVAALKRELSKVRAVELDLALNDIWVSNQISAGGAYTAADYFAALDGLTFKDVMALSDPTGEESSRRRFVAEERVYGRTSPTPGVMGPSTPFLPGGNNGPTYNMGTQSAGGVWNSPENVSALQGR